MQEDDINLNLQHIGDKLRDVRQRRRLSLRELASRADVSASLLSQIENGKANPSVMTLYTIAAALSVPLGTFFPSNHDTKSPLTLDAQAMNNLTPSEARSEIGINLPTETPPIPGKEMISIDFLGQPLALGASLIMRRDERASIELQGGVIWERLTSMSVKGIEFLQIEYGVGASSGTAMSRHPGSEFGYVLEGTLALDLGFDQHILYAGDSVIFNSSTPHRLTNLGECSLRAIWIVFDLAS